MTRPLPRRRLPGERLALRKPNTGMNAKGMIYAFCQMFLPNKLHGLIQFQQHVILLISTRSLEALTWSGIWAILALETSGQRFGGVAAVVFWKLMLFEKRRRLFSL